jgi:Mrp family chromosome partitioning ATPase
VFGPEDGSLAERSETAHGNTEQPTTHMPLVQNAMERLSATTLRRAGSEDATARAPDAFGLRDPDGSGGGAGLSVVPPQLRHAAAYRALAANLWAQHAQPATPKALLFAGCSGDAGRHAQVAAGYAATLAHGSDAGVLLIDTDPGYPAARALTGGNLDPARVDLDLLLDKGVVPQLPPKRHGQLRLLARTRDPALLPSVASRFDALARLVQAMRGQFQAVIINAADPAVHRDALCLCKQVDGVVLVVQSERTRKHSAEWTVQQVEAAGGRLLGVVMNQRRYRVPAWVYRSL